MRSPALGLALVLLLAARPVIAGTQEQSPPPAPIGQADSARAAKDDREVARRSAKNAERVRKEAEGAPPATVVVASLPRGQRPTMAVLAFRYGTVTNQANYGVKLPKGTKATIITDPATMAHEDNQNIGAGIAELVKAELTRGQSFRILERLPAGEALGRAEPGEPAAAPDSTGVSPQAPRVRLIVIGSITRFGGEDKVIGGAGILKKVFGGLGVSKKRTVVELTAQILDAQTGEVLLSITGFGVSTKGGGLIVVGGDKDGLASGGTATSNVTAQAIGEASRLAAQDLAAKITNARDGLLALLKEL